MKIKKKCVCLFVCVLITLQTAGCEGKHWSDYENAWVSSDPHIYISTYSMPDCYYSEIEIDGEIIIAETGGSNDGTGIEFCKPLEPGDDGFSEDDIIWDTSVEIKDGKLYLTVDVDNYGDNEGKTFILEQEINEDTADTEWWRL